MFSVEIFCTCTHTNTHTQLPQPQACCAQYQWPIEGDDELECQQKTSNQAFVCAADVGFCARRCVCTRLAENLGGSERSRSSSGAVCPRRMEPPTPPHLPQLHADWLPIQPLYRKLSSLCRLQVAITPRLAFSSCCFATETHAETRETHERRRRRLLRFMKDLHCTPGQMTEHYQE